MSKLNYEIIPQVGCGQIKFGMSPATVHDILGNPTKIELAVASNETDEEELEHYGNQHYEWFGKAYPDPTSPQITYASDKVIGITIFKQSGPLILKGRDIHKAKHREDILEALAKDEDVYYCNEQFYFFPKSGWVVATPENMKRFFFVELVLTSEMIPHLDFAMYEPSTALDG